MKGEGGFTLTELVLVVAISAILLGLATLNFSSMQKKSGIEKETRQLFTDLGTARLNALCGKHPAMVIVQQSSYIYKQYSSDYESPAAGRVVVSQAIPYAVTGADGSSVVGQAVLFDSRGTAYQMSASDCSSSTGIVNLIDGRSTASANVRINPTGSGASVDCVLIEAVRNSMGMMQNGACLLK